MINVNMGRYSRGTSPSHHTTSQPVLPSPTAGANSSSSKKKGLRTKSRRPMSMIDRSKHDHEELLWDGDEDGEWLSRSTSVSEVQRRRKEQEQVGGGKTLSKEAP